MFDAFYSDPHFGHKNIISFCNRPWDTVEDMNRGLIGKYKATVSSKHLVLWCGDSFFMPDKAAAEVMRELPGRKWLIIGNHDKSPRRMLDIGFELVTPELVFHLGGRTVRATHYPPQNAAMDDRALNYPKPQPGVVNMHGHTHSEHVVSKASSLHVGVDAWDYRPATRDRVEAVLEGLPAT